MAIVAALTVPALGAAGCTISSESPDSSVAGRAGPASGTTTTDGGGEAPDESSDQGPEATGDGEAATEETAGDTPVPTDTAPTTEDDSGATAGGGTTGGGTTGGDTGSQPDDDTGEAAGTSDEPAVAPTAPTGETATAPSDTGASGEDAAGATAPDTDPTPDTADQTTIAETAFDERSSVSTVGIGSVYFGMSLEEAAERVGTVWAGIPPGGADCYSVTPTNGPPGVTLWVYHGTIERVDIDTPLLRTQSGLGVGTHLGELRSRLGDKLVVEEHPYLAGWILATFVPTDPNDAAFRIAFDISGGEVIRFRAGRTEIVSLEACA